MAATFMAALLVVLHHHLPLIEILDKFAFLFVSASSVQTSAQQPGTVVIGIDQKTFEQDFLEQSPLDRCVMAEKLAAIYAARPSLLVIDFDLSPSLAGLMPNANGRSRELACESALYAQLREHATTTRTVLLQPFPVANEAAQAAKQAWKSAQQQGGLLFGDGALPVQFGFVQQQYMRPDTLAAVAGAVLRAAPHHGDEHSDQALELLNFRAFAREVSSVSWDQWHNGTPALSLAGKNVFLGAAYGGDDQFLTPIDDLYGVKLHAAAFVSLRNKIDVWRAPWAFLADIGIGMVFGVMVAGAWQGYLKYKLRRADIHQNQRAMAFLFLWALVFAYAAMLWLLMQASVYLVVANNVWISPLPMALGMTLDAFIFGAVHAFEHMRAQHGASHVEHADQHLSASRTVVAVSGLKLAFWLFIVGWALLLIAKH
jgi:hypothetical protein